MTMENNEVRKKAGRPPKPPPEDLENYIVYEYDGQKIYRKKKANLKKRGRKPLIPPNTYKLIQMLKSGEISEEKATELLNSVAH